MSWYHHSECIYLNESELKVEHQGNDASFLDFDIRIVDSVFAYKLFEQK